MQVSRRQLDDIGRDIVRERKAEIERDHISLEKSEYEGKDVISLCLRANMLANERDRMSDDEVLGQIGTLVGHARQWAHFHLFFLSDSYRCSLATRPRRPRSAGLRCASRSSPRSRRVFVTRPFPLAKPSLARGYLALATRTPES